ncbi:MAG: hypothetical protein J6D53_10065 [Blautia sp.]|nr:hypothetical protein [Blautia sp.]
MQQKSKLSFGPGAASIILIVVILSMSILGLLSYMMARNDLALTDRSARVTEEAYEVNSRAEKSFAQLDAISVQTAAETDGRDEYLEKLSGALPENMSIDGDKVVWTEEEGTHTLSCEALLSDDTEGHISWGKHKMTVEMEGQWN